MSSNIHGLLHICDDYELYGPLDNCSAFSFEKYLQKFKKMIRKPDKLLELIIKRYNEFENFNISIVNRKIPINGSRIHQRGPLLEKNY